MLCKPTLIPISTFYTVNILIKIKIVSYLQNCYIMPDCD